MQQKIIILDFGSQTTQLIGRRVRELDTFCEILPYNKFPKDDPSVIGVILSGSPYSVHDPEAFKVDLSQFVGKVPVLGICYGAQFISHTLGGKVEKADSREYGRANLETINLYNPLFKGFDRGSQVWMSHGDTITAIPEGFEVIGSTHDVKYAAFATSPDPSKGGECLRAEDTGRPSSPLGRSEGVWAVQFHPEVFHSLQGTLLLKNFVVDICGSRQEWSAASFVDSTVAELKEQLGQDRVILGQVMDDYKVLGLNVIGVDASEKFFADLAGVSDPEQKRKIIGRDFVEVFNAEAKKITDAKWLAQGTIYPDRIESLNITGKVIKSHHNVGGLPKEMNLQLCEPLKWLFKDEVRRVGRQLGMPEHLITRHPFPGPGLAVRILGDITPEKVRILQDADDIYIKGLCAYKVRLSGEEARKVLAAGVPADMKDGTIEVSLYDQIWQAGVILLSTVRSVGVMGDERTYEHPVALRAVTSTDAMTADWAHLPYDFMAKVSNEIINKVRGVNRVCYDISSKPPATIEWE